MEPTSRYFIRWRGRQQGPFTWAQIERKIEENEIGLLHEIYFQGRWCLIREANQQLAGCAETSSSPHPDAQAVVAGQVSASQVGEGSSSETWPIRWRGKMLEPISLPEIERRLERQEIGMFHETFRNGEWVTLSDFFVLQNLAMAQKRVASAPMRVDIPKSEKRGARLVLENIGREIKNKIQILRDINLVIEPNEFVALLGPSGSGKSTLMNAMTGRQRSTQGSITLNGEDLYENSWKYRGKIGHVPQKDIVHLPLTVTQELRFSAQLRLSSRKPAAEIEERVERVIDEIGLQERKATKNSNLSGGQIKRVSLGVELLSDPPLLFLDEATSGLDAGTEARMMTLFRRLADEGRTVVCITHNLENVCLCDLVAVLVGGRLAFYGPPADLLAYFKVKKLTDVYECLHSASPDEWARIFQSSEHHKKYVDTRKKNTIPRSSKLPDGEIKSDQPNSGLFQFMILTRRYFTVAFQDLRNIILLLVQAPIIAFLLGLVYKNVNFDDASEGANNQKILSFLLVVSAIWFGCINSAREIVKELPLYLRERAISLNLASYLGSKMAVLSLFCIFQCCGLLFITLLMTNFKPNIQLEIGCLILTSFVGMLMGLVVSALVKNEDKAIAIIPIILIPQVIFAGAILKLSGFAEQIAKYSIVSFWSLDAMTHTFTSMVGQGAKSNYTFSEDMTTILIFMVVLIMATAVALKSKDVVK